MISESLLTTKILFKAVDIMQITIIMTNVIC